MHIVLLSEIIYVNAIYTLTTDYLNTSDGC